jgi:glycosyltransferase involved in cell wall biosynthesis
VGRLSLGQGYFEVRIGLVYPHSQFPSDQFKLFDALAIVTYELTRRLAQGHEVTVYARRGGGDQSIETREGVEFRRFPQPLDRLIWSLNVADRLGLTPPSRPLRMSRLYYGVFAERVARDAARRRLDVIHIYGTTNFIPIVRRHNPGAVVVLHSHDHALVDFDRDLTAARLAEASLILGCSETVTQAIEARFPELAARCHALPNGIDERFLAAASEPAASRTVMFVGRQAPEKGVHVLLEAFAQLSAKHPDARLELIGPQDLSPKQFVDPFGRDPLIDQVSAFYQTPGSFLARLESIAQPLGPRVSFRGPVPNDVMEGELARAGIFVFPSLWQEPFGIPVIEAMAAGLPVVVARSGALPEIVEDGVSGIVVPRGDVSALADAIGSLLADPAKRAAMGRAARDRARRRYGWDQCVERLLELYEVAREAS